MVLVKSTTLNNTVLAMTVHYKELLDFLEQCIVNPALLLDKTVNVFKSEKRLYLNDPELNHRLKKHYKPVHNLLYAEPGNSSLSSMIVEVSKSLSAKLRTYYKDYLPGGRYQDPDTVTQTVLSELKPHKDNAESLFGINDWLDRILPNMAQVTKSAMIEFSFNKTMEWLKRQGEEQKQAMIDLAQKRRRLVAEQNKQEATELMVKKVQQRTKLVERGKEKSRKLAEAIKDLEREALIATRRSLEERSDAILSLHLPDKVKDSELRYLVKQQLDLRRKVYKQNVRIVFTENGKQKGTDALLHEFSRIVRKYPITIEETESDVEKPSHQQLGVVFEKPSLLVGCKIRHQFEEDQALVWYSGVILSYKKQQFQVEYPESNEVCTFSLSELQDDLYTGDLWFQ